MTVLPVWDGWMLILATSESTVQIEFLFTFDVCNYQPLYQFIFNFGFIQLGSCNLGTKDLAYKPDTDASPLPVLHLYVSLNAISHPVQDQADNILIITGHLDNIRAL